MFLLQEILFMCVNIDIFQSCFPFLLYDLFVHNMCCSSYLNTIYDLVKLTGCLPVNSIFLRTSIC